MKPIFFFLLLFSFADPLYAQLWHRAGNLPAISAGLQDGGEVRQILTYSSDSLLVLLWRSGIGYIFLSTDNGGSWSDTKNHSSSDYPIFVSPQGALVQIVQGHPNRSTDLGQTWSASSDSVIFGITDAAAEEFAAFGYPLDDSLHLFRSSDDGRSWKSISAAKLQNYSEIAYQAETGFYICTDYNLFPGPSIIYHSSDFGVHWDSVLSDPTQVSFLVTDHHVLCAGLSSDYIYVSTSGLKGTWRKKGIQPTSQFGARSKPSVRGGELMISGYLSSDTGLTWKKILFDSTLMRAGAATYIDSSDGFFVGSGDDVFHSTDHGATWKTTTLPVLLAQGTSVQMAATSPSSLWIPQYRFLSYSTDDGASWKNFSTNKFTVISAVASGIDGSLLAGVRDTGYHFIVGRTRDNGETWSFSSRRPTDNSIDFVGEPSPGKLIVIDEYGFCHRSQDDGKTWQLTQIGNQPDLSFSAFAIADSVTLYASSVGSFSLSHTAGATWRSFALPDPSTTITGLCSSSLGSILAIFDTVLLMRSTDGGMSWNEWATGVPRHTKLTGITRDADSGVYVSTGYGVYYQSQHDSTWVGVNDGLTDADLLGITTRRGKSLFVTTAHAEIFKTDIGSGAVRNGPKFLYSLNVQPNPVDRIAKISFSLEHSSEYTLELTDQLGRSLQHIKAGTGEAGIQTALLDPSTLPGGMYYLELKTPFGDQTCKIIVIK